MVKRIWNSKFEMNVILAKVGFFLCLTILILSKEVVTSMSVCVRAQSLVRLWAKVFAVNILWAFFTIFSLETIYLSPKLREKWPYLSNCQSNNFFFNTVHNLITFSIVFTNKSRGGGTLNPPPIITKVYLPPIITKVKQKWYHLLKQEYTWS